MICYINSNTLFNLSLNDGIFHTPSSELNDILILKSVMGLGWRWEAYVRSEYICQANSGVSYSHGNL